jgi:hypothetical protein
MVAKGKSSLCQRYNLFKIASMSAVRMLSGLLFGGPCPLKHMLEE